MTEAQNHLLEPPKAPSKPKMAVVVIHGMGEQRPMETLRGLVDALWTCDPDIVSRRTAAIYSKPDQITGSFELRRITTRRVPLEEGIGRRVDFFEFYWAHLMTGNTLRSVVGWLINLLIRTPASVPPRLLLPWAVGLTLFLGASLLMTLAGLKPELLQGVNDLVAALPGMNPELAKHLVIPAFPKWFAGLLAITSLGLGVFFSNWLTPVAGDAARYLSASPDNVEARQKIREAGVDLLNKLHAAGEYDRIVVVGHSLGSVIGYDVLNYAFGRLSSEALFAAHPAGSDTFKALERLERAAGLLKHAPWDARGGPRAAYRMAQREYQRELAIPQANGERLWLVSDFVTLGNPLSNADVLLGRNAHDLELRKSLREAPTSPPFFEKDDFKQKRFRFSYPVDEPTRIPHHAAVFAPVVWTNIYFPSVLIAFGDFISGPVAKRLGPGILDVRLKIGAPVFRHLDYWKIPRDRRPTRWLVALRRAVNLKRLAEADLWGRHAEAAEVIGDELPATLGTGGGGTS